MTSGKIRESVLAGSWYPGHAETLRRDIRRYLDEARVTHPNGPLTALVAPHAGYMYSGGVAAHAYKLLEGQSWDTVMILAPSHRLPFDGASVCAGGGYATPLGVVPVDEEVTAALLQHSPPFRDFPQAHAHEHAVEIQLPFLQVVLRNFRLVPVIMGSQSFDFCQNAARIIVEACRGRRVLLVASTDLSHFHSYEQARQLDLKVAERVAAFEVAALAEGFRKGDSEACGGGPLVTVMLAARELGADGATVLRSVNSGDVTGEQHGGVVGYMAAVFYRKERG